MGRFQQALRVLLGVDAVAAPRASIQSDGGGMTIVTPEQLEAAIRGEVNSLSGVPVTPHAAMSQAVGFRCVMLLSGVVANTPLDIKRRVGVRREDADDHAVAKLLKRRPNRWQTPSQFKRMLQAHKLLRGFGIALKVRGALGDLKELIPLHPDRVTVKQLPNLSLQFRYRHPNGGEVTFRQEQIFYLVGLTLDGVHGVTPITYARETFGSAISQERHGSNLFRNGTQIGSVFKLPKGSSLNDAQYARLKASLDQYRAGDGDNAGGTILLEDGMDIDSMAMSAQDAQWIESRKFTRSEIAMFFGVPPHMVGDTEKTTSFGTGIQDQTQGFITFTAEDEMTPWEETINRDLFTEAEDDLYARFNRAALVRGDLKARKEYYQASLQWGWMNPDEVRALEDRNPRADGRGGEYYDPPNTAGTPGDEKEQSNDPASAA